MILLALGILVALFVGFNIGGSSTGVAFGPAVGSNSISKVGAAALMTIFALIGGLTLGTEVIDTMGGEIVPKTEFTLLVSVIILFFVGIALLLSNLFGVPASTSMTAVGAIAGLGIATGTINWKILGQIVSWWLISPLVSFWICAVIGRYMYPYVAQKMRLDDTKNQSKLKEYTVKTLIVGIGCYMAFSAGASNTANAVAPLIGNGVINATQGVLIAGVAIGLGAFTVARRTLDTVSNDITRLPPLAAIIVEVVSATVISILSFIGIPASLAISATTCIIGLGWGRATRSTGIRSAVSKMKNKPEQIDSPEPDGRTLLEERNDVSKIGSEDTPPVSTLFSPASTRRIFSMWVISPTVSTLLSFLVFYLIL